MLDSVRRVVSAGLPLGEDLTLEVVWSGGLFHVLSGVAGHSPLYVSGDVLEVPVASLDRSVLCPDCERWTFPSSSLVLSDLEGRVDVAHLVAEAASTAARFESAPPAYAWRLLARHDSLVVALEGLVLVELPGMGLFDAAAVGEGALWSLREVNASLRARLASEVWVLEQMLIAAGLVEDGWSLLDAGWAFLGVHVPDGAVRYVRAGVAAWLDAASSGVPVAGCDAAAWAALAGDCEIERDEVFPARLVPVLARLREEFVSSGPVRAVALSGLAPTASYSRFGLLNLAAGVWGVARRRDQALLVCPPRVAAALASLGPVSVLGDAVPLPRGAAETFVHLWGSAPEVRRASDALAAAVAVVS